METSPPKMSPSQASVQASSWFARLHAQSVSVSDLRAFEAWREIPTNDQAYRQVEALWERGDRLKGDPDIAAALTSAFEARSSAPSRAWSTPTAYAAVSILVAVVLTLWATTSGFVGARTYETAVGQQKEIVLADGSEIRLDTDSQVAVRFGAFQRSLRLQRGRAFFSVAHDARRPFLVSAGEARVRAVGTRFSVARERGQVRVVLVQGVVTVSSAGGKSAAKAERTLVAGQQVTADGALGAPSPVDVGFATSWLQGQLVFRNLALKDAIAEVDRYTVHRLVLDAPTAADVPVSGVFRAGDPKGFAAAAADVCGLDAIVQANGDIVLRSKASSTSS